MQLGGKVALVTGGSRGIGRAIVEKLAKEGASTVFTFNSSTRNADFEKELLEGQDNKIIGIQADATDYDKAIKVVDKVEEYFGKIEILINNAGITRDKSLMLMTQKDWHDVLDVNLTGVFNYTRAVIIRMLKQRYGDIINISSYSGVFGMVGQTNYSASKAGIIGFTKALAKEVAGYNVRVNCIAPGFIETEMLNRMSEKQKSDCLNSIPMRRFGTPEEIAGTVNFLLSESAKYITGQVIGIDGGLRM